MTVIIATATTIYADSKVTTDSSAYSARKIIEYRGELLGLAGSNAGIEKFLRWYRGTRNKAITPDSDDLGWEVLVVSRKGIAVYNDCSLPDVVTDHFCYAGAGAKVAEGAILAGASAREAVEIACRIIDGCGLPVQEMSLRN